jgi:hypothetical protein
MVLGILRACYVSWLHQNWRGTGAVKTRTLNQQANQIIIQPINQKPTSQLINESVNFIYQNCLESSWFSRSSETFLLSVGTESPVLCSLTVSLTFHCIFVPYDGDLLVKRPSCNTTLCLLSAPTYLIIRIYFI